MIDQRELTAEFAALARREAVADLPTAAQIFLRAQALAAWERREAETKRSLRPASVAQLAALLLIPAALGVSSLALPPAGAALVLAAAALTPLALLLLGPLLADH